MSFTIAEVSGGRFSPPFMPTKTKPYVRGRLISFTAGVVEKEDKFTMDFDTELLSVAVGASKYYPTDYWGLKVNNEVVFESIYTKDLPEGCYLMAVITVKAGQELKFKFYNTENVAKHVWVNYQFLK